MPKKQAKGKASEAKKAEATAAVAANHHVETN